MPSTTSQPASALSAQLPNHAPAGSKVAFLATVPWLSCVLVALFVQYAIGPLVGQYLSTAILQAGVFVMAAVSLNIVNGYTGQFSMGHGGFMAVGAYVAGAITYYGQLYWGGSVRADDSLALLGTSLMIAGSCVGAVVAAGFGYLVGLPSLRLRGDYLAIVTLGFGEIIRVLLTRTGPQITDAQTVKDAGLIKTLANFPLNGSSNFADVPKWGTLLWIWLFAGIVCLIAYRLKYSSSGRAFLSIREDEIAARSMGVDLTKYKVRAFVLAAALGGLAGGLFAHIGVSPSPSDAGFQRSFEIIIFVVLGGLGSISGAAISAIVLTMLSEVLRGPEPFLEPRMLFVLSGAAVAGFVAMGVLKSMRNRGWRVALIGAMIPVLLLAFCGLSLLAKKPLGINLGDFRMILYALMLIVVMLVRPNGLMGVTELWDWFGPEKEAKR
jgi:branched-chain amino acid transport system permease protein